MLVAKLLLQEEVVSTNLILFHTQSINKQEEFISKTSIQFSIVILVQSFICIFTLSKSSPANKDGFSLERTSHLSSFHVG